MYLIYFLLLFNHIIQINKISEKYVHYEGIIYDGLVTITNDDALHNFNKFTNKIYLLFFIG